MWSADEINENNSVKRRVYLYPKSKLLAWKPFSMKLPQKENFLPGATPAHMTINPGLLPNTVPQLTFLVHQQLLPNSTISFQKARLTTLFGVYSGLCRVPARYIRCQTVIKNLCFSYQRNEIDPVYYVLILNWLNLKKNLSLH